MENPDVLTFTPVDHPDARVHRTGFDLTGTYVEHCWSAVIGPSATLLLRRMPTLWIERAPATITYGELSRTLGLGGGSGANSRLMRSIDRVVRHGLATWEREGTGLDVYLQAPELNARQLERLPEWTRRAHLRLLDAHAQSITQRDETGRNVSVISARLDRIQQPRTATPARPTTPTRTIGR